MTIDVKPILKDVLEYVQEKYADLDRVDNPGPITNGARTAITDFMSRIADIAGDTLEDLLNGGPRDPSTPILTPAPGDVTDPGDTSRVGRYAYLEELEELRTESRGSVDVIMTAFTALEADVRALQAVGKPDQSDGDQEDHEPAAVPDAGVEPVSPAADDPVGYNPVTGQQGEQPPPTLGS